VKIEIIEKSAKPVEVKFVVGGVYRETCTGTYFQLVQFGGNDRFTWLQIDNGYLCDALAKPRWAFVSEEMHLLEYVPNARLVIER